jgi:hypothetical protein
MTFKRIKIKAGNTRNSKAIEKFPNEEIGYFGLKLTVHVFNPRLPD